jgi:hypothetical protein
MSIRSNIAWTALGCVLLSGTANAADPAKPHDRTHTKPERHNPPRPGDPTTPAPATGADAVTPAAAGQAGAAGAFHKLSCTVSPAAGLPFVLINDTPAALPAGTIVWVSPVPINSETAIMGGPPPAIRMDGTSAAQDRYITIGPTPPGGLWQSAYSPTPPWQSCYAAVGMSVLMPAVPMVP